MMYKCSEKADELAEKLEEMDYPEECVSMAKNLAVKIADYEDMGDDKMDYDDKMKEGYEDMDAEDMRKSMKKSGIIISLG